MNGSAYRALAAVLSAAPVSDRDQYLARRPEIDRARLDEAIAVFDARFGRRRWQALAEKSVLKSLLKTAEHSDHIVPFDETAAVEHRDAERVVSEDVDLPPKTRRALNIILAGTGPGGS